MNYYEFGLIAVMVVEAICFGSAFAGIRRRQKAMRRGAK